jgi:hypothetical protein
MKEKGMVMKDVIQNEGKTWKKLEGVLWEDS